MLISDLVQTDKHSIIILLRRKNLRFLRRTNHIQTRYHKYHMKKIVYLIILSLINISCQKEKTQESIIISGFVKNKKNDTIKLSTNDKYKLYNQKNENVNIILNSENRFTDTLNISDGYYNLEIGDNNFILFLKSGDNLNLESDNSKLNISGTGEIENKYLIERNNLDNKLASINYWYHYYKLNENDFLKLADSICNIPQK